MHTTSDITVLQHNMDMDMDMDMDMVMDMDVDMDMGRVLVISRRRWHATRRTWAPSAHS